MKLYPSQSVYSNQFKSLTKNLVNDICAIETFPEGLLPHTAYIEEESDTGYPVYNRYSITKIFPDGSCEAIRYDKHEAENLMLSEINFEWLLTIWNYYNELLQLEAQKERYIFLYPIGRFHRSSTDREIIIDYESDEGQAPVPNAIHLTNLLLWLMIILQSFILCIYVASHTKKMEYEKVKCIGH